MSKPKILYYRPDYWRLCKSDKLDLIYVPVEGKNPVFWTHGLSIADEIGAVIPGSGKQALIQAFREHQPDFFLYFMAFGEFTPELVKELKGISPKTKFIFSNYDQVIYKGVDRWLSRRGYLPDIMLTNTREKRRWSNLKKWGVKKIDYWVDGFDPRMFPDPKKTDYDCFFGGGNTCRNDSVHLGRFPNSKFRYELVKSIASKHNTKIRGGGWKVNGQKNKLVYDRGVFGLDYTREIQRAKIVLGCYHLDLKNYYTKRTIYAMASGRVYATKYIPNMEEDGFINRKNVLWFDSVKEAQEVIRYYLENEQEREIIAKNAREFAFNTMCWDIRSREFEDIIERLL